MNDFTPRQTAILDAAQSLFLRDGFQAVSMDEVAQNAEVAKQTLYNNFSNKEELFLYVMQRMCHSQGVCLFQNGFDLTTNPRDILHNIASKHVTLITNPDALALYRIVVTEGAKNPVLAEQFMENGPKQMITGLAEFLTAHHKNGTMNTPDATYAADQFFAMLKGKYFLHILLNFKPIPKAKELKDHANQVVDDFMKLYGI